MAADLLVRSLQTGQRADVRCLLETCLVVRGTTGVNVAAISARKPMTNSAGEYYFPSLLPRMYSMEAEMTGFKKVADDGNPALRQLARILIASCSAGG